MKTEFLRLGHFLREGMRFEVVEEHESLNYGSALFPVRFKKGSNFVLSHLSPHNPPPKGQEPDEDNTMSGWILSENGLDGVKQSSRQLLESALSGLLRVV
jgi:hypothetical protein